jgi:hypothetical protein
VVGAITSTARQVGSAVGIAVTGALVTGVAPAGLAQVSRAGWLLMAACGLFLLAAAHISQATAKVTAPTTTTTTTTR